MITRPLSGRTVIVTGAARRVGRIFALACARAGADVIIHHAHSDEQAREVRGEIETLGQRAWILSADLQNKDEASHLIARAHEINPLDALVNSAAIFEALSLQETTYADWQRHLDVNLTAPFILSQAFAKHLAPEREGRIVNILDWRALRPGADHFPYTISKAALSALTRSLAVALAPRIAVNGLALGAILPPADGAAPPDILKNIPVKRWSDQQEVEDALIFLLAGPAYITGEIIHLDGGRHLI